MTPAQRFWLLLKPNRKEIYQVYSFALFKGIIALSIPLGIQSIINLIQGGSISTAWIVLSILIGTAVGLQGYMQLMQMRIMENIQQSVFTRAAFDFTIRIPKINLLAIRNHYAPELMNRFFEIMTIQKSLAKIIIDFSSAILQIIFCLILLSLYHTFFVMFSVFLVVIVLFIIRYTSRKALNASMQESEYKYKLVSWLEEMARAKDSFKMAGTTGLPIRQTDNRVGGYLQSREEHYQVLRSQYIYLLVFKIMVALGLLIVGGVLVINQQLNIGQFVASEIIILLVIESTEKIILNLENVYDIFTSLNKVSKLEEFELDEELNDSTNIPLISSPIKLSLKQVNFFYETSSVPVISDLDFTFEPGGKYVITGGNGSGKSTLMHLLAGLYKPSSGSICVNDFPLRQFSLSAYFEVIGNGLREETIFEGTISDNITLGRAFVSEADLHDAVKHTRLLPFIQSMPQGLHEPIQPLGKKLPASVVQKIILARSIVNQPRLLLLENMLEAINEQERKEIIDFLCSADRPWTLIAVSGDTYLHEKCTAILQMKEGRWHTR